MDQILHYLAGALGVDNATFLLILGVVVAVANLVGKLIPDDATGALGLVRKACKVLGLYISNRVVDGKTPNDATRALFRSPLAVTAAALAMMLVLTGCTAVQKERVTSTLSAICTSAPLAQALYNSALASHDTHRVNDVLNYLQASCPAILLLVQVVPERESSPAIVLPPPVAPTIGPERG